MLKEQIEILEKLLDEKVSEDREEELNNYKQIKGASDQELDNIEEKFGIKLPQDFRDFYKHKNGSGYHFHILYPNCGNENIEPFYLFSADEIIDEKESYFDEEELMSEHYDEEELEDLDNRIKPYLRNERWIPFATLAGGSLYLMLDYDPSKEGKEGQIISYIHDPDFVYFVAENFTELLKQSNENLKETWEEIDY
ncbi:SMI1/KNR4 family protein [Bacillus sp. MUM 13]|uniref:SMI1/KNR4 family protein n=1 Tax=Bacillus sp. MUM 13 TaxID=1678001 RepID=UPI0008F55DFC|nr:SMI1/KNR4 family protein [Bacillus sp. MUM 13]OIK13515.1 SMI1/KNR4 family protein [Bacillus sp. MUM 13]